MQWCAMHTQGWWMWNRAGIVAPSFVELCRALQSFAIPDDKKETLSIVVVVVVVYRPTSEWSKPLCK